jgi:uncharacterized protein (DUF486 family)
MFNATQLHVPVIVQTSVLLILSNVFMTFAWYAHLKNFSDKRWFIAAVISWGIAFFEYIVQVPANRVGYTELTLSQLKILQEVITLTVFIPFAILYMQQPMKTDYLWAGLCIIGAVYFIFRS